MKNINLGTILIAVTIEDFTVATNSEKMYQQLVDFLEKKISR